MPGLKLGHVFITNLPRPLVPRPLVDCAGSLSMPPCLFFLGVGVEATSQCTSGIVQASWLGICSVTIQMVMWCTPSEIWSSVAEGSAVRAGFANFWALLATSSSPVFFSHLHHLFLLQAFTGNDGPDNWLASKTCWRQWYAISDVWQEGGDIPRPTGRWSIRGCAGHLLTTRFASYVNFYPW